jgi:hypothetical protein
LFVVDVRLPLVPSPLTQQLASVWRVNQPLCTRVGTRAASLARAKAGERLGGKHKVPTSNLVQQAGSFAASLFDRL